ncbi:MAG: penicillin-insensitive murein endopeptidase, partial [Rhizobiaceae bacterium]|nr:penicillin-insensitive murein endopeptidase [Rhizobiaceae bacterium]
MFATIKNRIAGGANPVALLSAVLLSALVLGAVQPAAAQSAAKDLFSAKAAPAALPPESYGFYSKGCISGAVALPTDGPTWQAMRLSRNRRWGHPTMVAFLEKLSGEASARGIWPGLLVGDISQPRGGPMASGHASHQVGLDADIWFQPMPRKKLSANEREKFPFRSVLRKGTLAVDDRIWSDNYRDLIKLAAGDPKVQRVFVHPGVKKKLCETAGSDRSWLRKVRPIYGHDEHFHIRLFCQPGSPGCKPQEPVGKDEGCDDLGWWFNVALKPPKPGAKPGKPRPAMTMAALPAACRVVLNAPDG